jgi:CubicO group peptidase (beta-lactamase class C family)
MQQVLDSTNAARKTKYHLGVHALAVASFSWLWTATALASPKEPTAPQAANFSNLLRSRVLTSETIPYQKLAARMAHYGVPGVAVAIIENGEVVFAQGYGVTQQGSDEAVNADTLFSVGSVSKTITAALTLKMAEQQQVDLNNDIRPQLASWRLPESEFMTADGMNLRMLLSHTAGLNIHGFADYQPGEALPNVLQTLNGEHPAKNEALTLVSRPGERYRYSGGGYTLVQQLLSETAQQSFPALTKDILTKPLGMARSTFQNPLPESVKNVAKAHNRDGDAVALPRGYESFPEMAASGFWTSANDLSKFVQMLLKSYTQGGYLSQAMAIDMMTRVAPSQHGLGPRVEGVGDQFMFHHGGANDSYRAWIEGHLATGNGLVVLTNGSNGSSLFVEIRNAVADAMEWKINQAVKVPSIKISPQQLETYTGQYEVNESFPLPLRQQMAAMQGVMNVRLEGQQLKLISERSGRSYDLLPITPDQFIVQGISLRLGTPILQFYRNAKNQVQGIRFIMSNAENYLSPIN